MIEGSRRLPWQHITIRVPWHDGGWNGRACIAPSANTSCLVLRRIASAKRDEQDGVAGKLFDELAPSELPPCIDERVGFMCDHDLVLTKQHPYKLSSPKTHGHFGETKLRIEAYSAACIPFGWMLKSNVEGNESKGSSARPRRCGLLTIPSASRIFHLKRAGCKTRRTSSSCWTHSSAPFSRRRLCAFSMRRRRHFRRVQTESSSEPRG